ncbi:response regulator [Piscinibacter sp. XHJ-5]|uniref:response regulator n=1 Tax=Piscinibacter sp. XHJ-5 TaxID=3037797 RepID=UPI0024528905|nr:response regulator [Piscinibacter sp. XHJ-5]
MKQALCTRPPAATARAVPGRDSDFALCDTVPAPLRDAMRVLVVEDDPVQGLVLMLFLERFGIEARLVTDGLQAVTAVKSGAYTLVLMDVQLPVIDGVEATRFIRSWERAAGRAPLPVVAVTASCMSDECESYLSAGMDRVLRKPFSVREFGELVLHYMLGARRCEALG